MSPWFGGRRRFGRGPAKKFRDGMPDPDHWGPGFYENLRAPPRRAGARVYEVSPVGGRESDVLPSASPRSLEIVKDPGEAAVRVLASAAPGDASWPAETGHDCAEASPAAPAWARAGNTVAFDVELARQLAFAPVAPPAHLLDQLVRTLTSRADEGAWVQAVFASDTGALAPVARAHHAALTRALGKDDDTAQLARRLAEHYEARASSPLVALSVRGAIRSASPMAASDALTAALGSVSIEYDSLGVYLYPMTAALPWLESRELASEGAYALLEANASMWGDMRLGIGREMVPFLVVTPRELAALLRVPDDPALRVDYRRRRRGGLEAGVLGHDLSSDNYAGLSTSPACVAAEHAGAHTYVLGGTGTGKTSLLRSLALHLATPKDGVRARALVIIDVKDDDALGYLSQMGADALDSGRVTYIDVTHTDFAINPLELPPHEPASRDLVVSRHIGQVTSMLKEVYSQQSLLVQVERVVRLLLAHLYSRTASPTMADLYGVVTQCISDPAAAARRMALPSPDLAQALEALTKMPRDSWIPLVNRIEPFATDRYMSARFCARHGTVDFGAMLGAGQVTIFRVSEAETPAHAHPVVPTAIALGVWNALLARAEAGAERTPVTLFLDEFQTMRSVDLLAAMLSRGRSLGLGLVLAHQNLSQVDGATLDMIRGNSTTHICGRVLGADARAVAAALDPAHAATLVDQLSGLPNHVFLISRTPPDGAERAPPARFAAHAPPPPLVGIDKLAEFVARMSEDHRPADDAASSPLDLWRAALPAALPSPLEWHVLLSLRSGPDALAGLARSAVAAGLAKERHEVSSALASMARRGLIERAGHDARGGRRMVNYAHAAGAREYLPGDFGAIGTAAGIEEAARAAFEHYAALGHFVAIGTQGGTRSSGNTVDMVAYDYESDRARSVEIESRAEVRSNPEHVAYNMSKWEAMGFTGCDVWSVAPRVERIRAGLAEPLRSSVRCFVLQDGEWVSGPAIEGGLAGAAGGRGPPPRAGAEAGATV